MAENTSDSINSYIVEIENKDRSFLGGIRHWENLKAATDGPTLWIKDFTPQQIESVEVQSIPYKKIYYQVENLLFFKGSRLPEKKMKSVLLWSPLSRLLPLELPSLNHNYFGISGKIMVNIVASHTEQNPVAILTAVKKAAQYIEGAAKVRLDGLSWIGIDDDALIAGTPLLPLEGQTYWLGGGMLIPTGFDLEFPQLYTYIKDSIAPGENIIMWQKNGSYILLPKHKFIPLSISSFRLTYSA